MIARLWRGVVATNRLDAYIAYVDSTGVGAYRQVDGNHAAQILTRDLGDDRAELIAFSLWDDADAIRRFAGDDIDAMVLYPEDHDYLLAEPTLTHYVVHSTAPEPERPPTTPVTVPAPAQARDIVRDQHRNTAEAFSGHRFRDTYDHLAPDIVWVLVGAAATTGRDEVIAACEHTLAELADTATDFLRFLTVSDDQTVVVDSVGHYTDSAGGTSTVASCDIYEFRDGLVARITSYSAEIDAPGDAAG